MQIPALREAVNCYYSHAFCLGKRDWDSGVCKSLVLLRVAWQTDRQTDSDLKDGRWFHYQWQPRKTHKHMRVPDAVKVCAARPHIATVPVTDSNYIGDNSTKFVMTEEKHLLIGTETVSIAVRKQTGLSGVLLSTGRVQIVI